MSNCERIEQATRGISEKPSAEELQTLTKVFQDAYPSRLLSNADLIKKSFETAKELDAKGLYTSELPTDIKGAKAHLQQNHGKPQFLELTDGNLTEGLRLDSKTSEPVISSFMEKCSDNYIGMSTTMTDGKPSLQFMRLPTGKELIVKPDGTAY